MEILGHLDPVLRALWYVALTSSLLFLVLTALSFAGFDGDGGGDVDVHAEAPVQMLSLRNLINFLLGFSWTGIAFYHSIGPLWLLLTLSVGVGLLFVLIFFWLLTQLNKLSEDNTFQLESTLYKQAEVYLTIPAGGTGKGKVLVSAAGAVHELDAVTYGEALPTGSLARVTGIENNQLLIVEKL
ncbi:MAG: NfeD family protein [Saprospiraceae bacterium]|nr:NfeD family protein [Saprospiraceae bacterium]